MFLFFFQAEDGIRDRTVTGVQTCALPISRAARAAPVATTPRGSGPGTPRRRRLVLADHPDHDALHDDIALVHPQRAHGGVRGLESDPAARLAVEPFHRGAGAVHERHHGLAIVGLVTFVHDDEI